MSIGGTIKTVCEAGRCMTCRKPDVDPDTGKSTDPHSFVAEIDISGMTPRLCYHCLRDLAVRINALMTEMEDLP